MVTRLTGAAEPPLPPSPYNGQSDLHQVRCTGQHSKHVKTKERKRIVARTNGLPKGRRKDGEVRPGTPMRSMGMGQISWTNQAPPPVFQLGRSWRLSNMGRALVPTPLSSCGRISDGDEELSHAIDVLDDLCVKQCPTRLRGIPDTPQRGGKDTGHPGHGSRARHRFRPQRGTKFPWLLLRLGREILRLTFCVNNFVRTTWSSMKRGSPIWHCASSSIRSDSLQLRCGRGNAYWVSSQTGMHPPTRAMKRGGRA